MVYFIGDDHLVWLLDTQNLPFPVVCLAECGADAARAEEILKEYLEDYIIAEGQICVVMVGSNNSHGGKEKFKADFRNLKNLVQEHFSYVFICRIPPINRPDIPEDCDISEWNRWISTHAKEKTWIMDTYRPFIDVLGVPIEDYYEQFDDDYTVAGVSLSNSGLELLRDMIILELSGEY